MDVDLHSRVHVGYLCDIGIGHRHKFDTIQGLPDYKCGKIILARETMCDTMFATIRMV